MRAKDRFQAALEAGPLVLDAAIGTRLIASGLSLKDDDPSLWNLSRPDSVAAIHRVDRIAGAHALTTNTFGANRVWLERYGRADQFEAINREAVSLAREAADPEGFVLGNLGPTGVGEPGTVRDQARLLADAGVDALLFETFLFEQAVTALEEVAGLVAIPLLVSLHQWPEDLKHAARVLEASGADVIGMNCRPGTNEAIEFAARLREVTELPLLVKPSAADRADASREPREFSAAFPRLAALGVRLIGGCCGTTELHVAALRNAWYAWCSR